MFGPYTIINFIRQFIKIPDNIWKILHTDISDGIPLLFVFLWTCFGLDTRRCNQPLYWSYQIIFLLWICDSHIVQTAKLQRYVQNDVVITTLDLFVFTNISTTTIFHFNSCEINKSENFLTYELLLSELLPSGATMINRRWCYNC